jgi:hypothetical protein
VTRCSERLCSWSLDAELQAIQLTDPWLQLHCFAWPSFNLYMSKRPRFLSRDSAFHLNTVEPSIVAAAPWIQIMQQAVPFSSEVCVAGSAGTWLAEFSLLDTRPTWDPNDIDVFVMVRTHFEYESLCNKFLLNLQETLSLTETTWRTKAHRKHAHMLTVQCWVEFNGSEVFCPEFSLIHSPILRKPIALMDTFDIDICKVSVHVRGLGIARRLCFITHYDVFCHIIHRVMHCIIRKDSSKLNFHYPMQKSLARVSKYVQRGYCFKSLAFVSSDSELNVADFVHVWLPPDLSEHPALSAPGAVV